jgi:hypothetical protein
MLKRRSIARVARLLVGLLAFAQAALAWSACDWLDRAPQRAIAQHQSQPAEGDCHHAAVPMTNLCLMHCTNDQQSLDKPSLQLPALADAAVLVVHAPLAITAGAGAIRRNVSPFSGAPPPRILFGAMRT